MRAAILLANVEPGTQTIEIPPGVFDLNLAGWYEDAGQTGDLDITDDVILMGSGPESTQLTTTLEAERAFDIHQTSVSISRLSIRELHAFNPFDCGRGIRNEAGTLVLSHVSLIHNVMRGDGGAICNEGGSVTITDSSFITNGARLHGSGGAIFSRGELELTRVVLRGNWSTSLDGGAIFADSAELNDVAIIANQTTEGDDGPARGAGIAVDSLTMVNVTVADNQAGADPASAPTDSRGGGVFVFHDANLTNVTIVDNKSGVDGGGGGIAAAEGAQITVTNSIISRNAGGDCLGAITSAGHNIGGDSTCGFGADGDLNSTDPLIGSLLPVGSTYAQAPLLGSPAIDSADAAACPAADQRGVGRPQGLACDRGAYEVIPLTLGDLNCDGLVDVRDALDLLIAFADVRGADCLSAADVNGDHIVDAGDVLAILLL